MKNLVSIILPTYNGGKYIKTAIESVITQSFSDWELLVIDDGSIDNTKDIVNEYTNKDKRIIYLKNEQNLGIQKTLNKGIEESKGEYIARIDDDDEWVDKDKLARQVEFLESNTDHVLVGTGVVVVDEEGKEMLRYLVPQTDRDIRSRLLGKNCFIHSSILMRKDTILSLGGYDESQETKHLEDYDLWLRLGILGKLANLPFYMVNFTQRSGSISSVNKREQFKKSINIIKKFKNKYPWYYWALLRSCARVIVYGFILKSPLKIYLNKIIKIYKEN